MATARLSARECIEILEATIANGSCRYTHPQLVEKLCQILPGRGPRWDPKRNRWKLSDGFKEPPLPRKDCLAPPGPGKVAIMARRYEEGFAIMVPPILFFDPHGHYLGCRGDAISVPTRVHRKGARSMEKRHWNGSVIWKGYEVTRLVPTELEVTKEREIEKRQKIERRHRRREERKRAALEQTAEAAMTRPKTHKGDNYFLLVERHELMKSKGPMCKVCRGKGKIPHDTERLSEMSYRILNYRECNTCQGSGRCKPAERTPA